jgi:hypothetical protein
MKPVRMFSRIQPSQEVTEGPWMSVEGVKVVVLATWPTEF